MAVVYYILFVIGDSPSRNPCSRSSVNFRSSSVSWCRWFCLFRVVSSITMPKPQYLQKFRNSWLQDPHLKDWLQVIESTAGQVPKCKFCGTILRSHYGDIKTHGMSKKYQQNTKVTGCFIIISFGSHGNSFILPNCTEE